MTHLEKKPGLKIQPPFCRFETSMGIETFQNDKTPSLFLGFFGFKTGQNFIKSSLSRR